MSQTVTLVDLESTFPNMTSQYIMPRHGILQIGTALTERGHDVAVYVESLNGVDHDRLVNSDIVGFSVTAPNLSRVLRLSRDLKLKNPDQLVIVGGPHATVSPREVLAFADFVVRDEAETTIGELITAIESKAPFSDILGLSYWDEMRAVHNPRRPYMSVAGHKEDLALLRGYRPGSALTDMVSMTQRCALVGTSRGCPFPCSFCYENMIGGTGFRRNSTRELIADIQAKKAFFATNRFWITDSNFGTNPNHTEQVLRSIIDADLGCTFSSLCRVEIGRRPQLLKLMRRAGMTTVSVGMEAIRDEQLTSIEKRQSVDDIRRAIDQIHSHGIAVFGLFMVGFDSDTVNTPWEITEFCRKEAVDGLSLYCLSEYPALPGKSLPRHRICEDNLDYYSGHFVTTFPKRVRPSVLERNVYDALLAYYSAASIVFGLASGDKRSLRFHIPLYGQMRRMAFLSKVHCAALRNREERYYSNEDALDVNLLRTSPWLAMAVPDDTMECWSDAVESGGTSDELPLASYRAATEALEDIRQSTNNTGIPQSATIVESTDYDTSSAIYWSKPGAGRENA